MPNQTLKTEELKDAKYVIIDGEDGCAVVLREWQEDIFDEDRDTVLRRVTAYQDMILNGGYGRRIDQLLADCRLEVIDRSFSDSERVRVEMTVGDLRRLDYLAGLFQGELRILTLDVDLPVGEGNGTPAVEG